MLDKNTYRRAVGEVVMIVVGVLIALAASDWQQGRSERRTELDVSSELRTALSQDLQDLENQVTRYESLKSSGLDLISDDMLRSQIARVYEQSYARLDDAHDSERMVILDLLRPYVLVHFKDLRFNVSATPLDYGFVSTDQEFLNLADYRLQLVRQNHMGNFDEALPEIRRLVAALDAALGD